MKALSICEIENVSGGMYNGSPGTGNTWIAMNPNSPVHLKVGPVEFDGTAGDLASGWQQLKQEAVNAGWTALQGVSLIEAGIACDFYSDWQVCTDAQQQVDFIMDQPNG